MPDVLLLSDSDVEVLLDPATCISAVEAAFKARGLSGPRPFGVLGIHTDPPGDTARPPDRLTARPPGAVTARPPDRLTARPPDAVTARPPDAVTARPPDRPTARTSGVFHIKAACGEDAFACKLNANFPGNPEAHGLPTIQGLVLLADLATGSPLAVMPSGVLTRRRTAAATAVAAKHLAPGGAPRIALIGCGAQARDQIAALLAVVSPSGVACYDTRAGAAEAMARDLVEGFRLDAVATGSVAAACEGAGVIVTCTTARSPFLTLEHVRPGAFVAAVGADNEHKSEIAPALMAASAVITDDTPQCAHLGDLHHAVAAGAMRADQVRAELAEVVAGLKPGRLTPEERIVFDSTGLPLQDVAAAAIVVARARAAGRGGRFDFAA